MDRDPRTVVASDAGSDAGVPVYVYPTVDPAAWQRLIAFAGRVRFAVVNVADGPGTALDLDYADAIGRLRDAGVPLVGYVDTDYARRAVDEVAADAAIWVERYGVRGVFLDQVAGRLADLQYYALSAVAARAAGAQFVVANPGTHCHPGLVEIANVVVTFEGPWRSYRSYRPEPWMRRHPASRFCHLVFDVPGHELVHGPDLAARRHAGTSFFTDGSGDNPWDRVPQATLSAARPVHGEGGRLARLAEPSPFPRRRYATAATPSGTGEHGQDRGG